ncbi:hypothetical protein CsSME_00010812 [Camellia sinensis var. sinensis]
MASMMLAEGKAILHWKAYYVGKVLGISFDLGVDLLDGGYNGCEGTWLRAWCVWGIHGLRADTPKIVLCPCQTPTLIGYSSTHRDMYLGGYTQLFLAENWLCYCSLLLDCDVRDWPYQTHLLLFPVPSELKYGFHGVPGAPLVAP